MAQTLCIAWLKRGEEGPTDDPQVCWGIYSTSNRVSILRTSLLSEVVSQLPNYVSAETLRTLVIIPGKDVLITPIQIPSNRGRYLERALPFLLEEQLLESIDNYFFAFKKVPKSKDIPVAAIKKARIEAWLEKLKEFGLSPDYLLPSTLALPHEPNKINVYLDDEEGVIRGENWRCTACHIDQLGFFTEAMIKEMSESKVVEQDEATSNDGAIDAKQNSDSESDAELDPSEDALNVQILYSKKGINLDKKVAKVVRSLNEKHSYKMNIQALYLPKSFHSLLFESALNQVKNKTEFQLLQQEYRPVTKRKKLDRKVPFVATLLITFFILNCVYLYQQGSYFRSMKEAQASDNVALYKELFPQDKRVRRIRSQMMAHLKKRGTGQTQHFLHYFQAIGDSIVKTRGRDKLSIDLRRFVFDQKQGEVRLDLLVKDFPYLDTLKVQLEQKNMSVSIDNANKDGAWVKARVRIKPGHTA